MLDYNCRICRKNYSTHIAVVYYPRIRDISFSMDNLVCSNKQCQHVMSRELTEGTRDKKCIIYPLTPDSLKQIPYSVEKKKLEAIIREHEAFRWRSERRVEQSPKRTSQDKSIARKPIQGNLFHIHEENH